MLIRDSCLRKYRSVMSKMPSLIEPGLQCLQVSYLFHFGISGQYSFKENLTLAIDIFSLTAFDGKKSMSAIGKNRKEKIDHYTIVSRGKFLDLFVPKDGTGAQIAYELHEVLKKYLAKESLIYIGCDR